MKYKSYSVRNFKKIPQISLLSREQQFNIEVVSKILPFKTNNYVVDELIDWDNFENDPFFILNFPQKEMLEENNFMRLAEIIKKSSDKRVLDEAVKEIRLKLNPHPAGQLMNVPELGGVKMKGMQHKYRETLLFFPSQGQTCHAYCTFCFRWPQFSGMDDMKFAMNKKSLLIKYLKEHPLITDLLITGGDPMTMSTRNLERYLEAIIESTSHNLQSIRIGTKSLSFWPYRFTTDKDADSLLRLFEKVIKAGYHLAFMAHFSHPRELATPAVEQAVRRIRNTGAEIRTQSPIMRHINDNAKTWSSMWEDQVNMGMIPYYMFVARNTGAQHFFALSLVESWKIYRKAFMNVSGLARTARGPCMSSDPGKIQVMGVSKIKGEKVIVLNFLQARVHGWVQTPFFAKYDKNASWITDLRPAFEEPAFFYEKEFRNLVQREPFMDDQVSSF